jgi:hypothetical protein
VVRKDKIAQGNKNVMVGVRFFTPGLWQIPNPSREGEKGDFHCGKH